jgi:nickel-dependent lactate racemase
LLEEIQFASNCTVLPTGFENAAAAAGDATAKLESALESPFDFPKLSESIVPGDRIAIAVSRQIPQVDILLERLVDFLVENNIEVSDITIVLPTDDFIERNTRFASVDDDAVWQRLMNSVRISYQRADDPNALAFLAPNQAGDPIYVNRDLFDADMVIPILRNDQANDRVADGIMPDYCHWQRFDEAVTAKTGEAHVTFDADEVNDQLGVFFICEVIVGPGNTIEKIIAGNRKTVREQREKLLDEIWAVENQAPADLVVATVEGDPDEHNWQSIARAIDSANRVTNDGAIVLLTELAEKPGRQLKKALNDAITQSAEPAPNNPFHKMAEVIAHQPVHLRCRLSEEQVEDLGLGFVGSDVQVQRLVDNAKQCVVLRDAHRCRVRAE